MVNEGKTNDQIYQYIIENYGKNQVAVPHNSWMKRLSMGLPYLLMGMIVVVATGFGWFWTNSGRDEEPPDDPGAVSDSTEESIDQLVKSDKNNPLG